VKTSIALDPELIVFVSQLPSSIVALCEALSSFFHATTSPTFAWTGCGLNLKFLIETFTVAAAPAGAVAQAAALAGLEPAVLAGGADAAAETVTEGAALVANEAGVVPPPQAERVARMTKDRSGRAGCRMIRTPQWALTGRGEADRRDGPPYVACSIAVSGKRPATENGTGIVRSWPLPSATHRPARRGRPAVRPT
jgi:hypothetical protein